MAVNTITALFQKVGAPLKNDRWSWGASSTDGKKIFLRVWQDEDEGVGGQRAVRLTDNKFFQNKKDLGDGERRDHLAMIEAGAPGYLIFCIATKPLTVPRKMQDFVGDRYFPIKELFEHEGDTWARYGAPIKA